MRWIGILAVLMAAGCLPSGAEEVSAVDQALTCAHTFEMRAEDLRAEGDGDGALEIQNMSEALLAQATAMLEASGEPANAIEDRIANTALITGFRYGAGEDTDLIASCLASWDSP